MKLFLFIDIYRNSFLDNALGGHNWDDGSFFMFTSLIIIVSIMAYLSRRTTESISRVWIIILSTLLICVLGLRGDNVGIDTIRYRESFETALTANAFKDSTIEPGFRLIQKFLRLILPSSELAVLIYSSVTVILITKTIWKYRKKIDIFVALSFYVGLFFLQAMNLLRIYLAAAIIMSCFHFLEEKKYVKFVFSVLLTSLIHYSTLVLFAPLILIWFYRKYIRVTLLVYIITIPIVIALANHFEDVIFIARYEEYTKTGEVANKIGPMLFLEYIPSFLLLIYVYHYRIKGHWVEMLVGFSLMGFFFRLITYYLPAAGRLSIHFMALYLLIIPYFVKQIKLQHPRLYYPFIITLIGYFFVRVHFYLQGYLATDGIMPYNFFWED